MNNTELRKRLEILGSDTVAEIVKQLLEADKKATGALINSIKYEILEAADGLMLNILSSDYFNFIDEGRKPGKPPPVKAILPWIQAKGIRFTSNGKMISQESTAFIIARSIGIKGIKPLGIKQATIENILNRKKEYIAAGIKLDISEYIKKEIFI